MLTIIIVQKNVDKPEFLSFAGGSVKLQSHFEKSPSVSYKFKNTFALWPSQFQSWYFPKRKEKKYPQKDSYAYVHIRFIHSSQTLETAQIAISEKIDTSQYIHTQEYCSVKKKIDTCSSNMDESETSC